MKIEIKCNEYSFIWEGDEDANVDEALEAAMFLLGRVYSSSCVKDWLKSKVNLYPTLGRI